MYAIPRKKRKNKSIEISEKLFSEAIHNQDYEKAASVVFWCVLKEFAQEGIISALENGNSFYERKKYRNRGL